jgi:hypothetical protein
VYRLSVTLRNRAPLDVAAPALDLALTDAQGKPIARRVLQMSDLNLPLRNLKPGSELPIQVPLGIGDRRPWPATRRDLLPLTRADRRRPNLLASPSPGDFMSALICGSLAFDTITNFPGRFSQQILPDQVHILNVSFLVPTLRREFGGCAGNIAYTLQALGGQPVVMAALGSDGGDYLARLQGWASTPRWWVRDESTYTAQAIIITDEDNNQITAFHPGAMQPGASQRWCHAAPPATWRSPSSRPTAAKRDVGPRRTAARRRRPVHLRPGPAAADVRRRRAAALRRAWPPGWP